ncbi:uncharacterized protein B0H64DRAFT_412440 [Chaetomium fimeti]|uniref:DUF7924 domain-containing protein n=1 Tax=Chaetomium fimeti TaxID=1854472 RepID=A0AAE0H5W9_9PEZI|nr:hypothetical protein B0H64DRAFT_412440 [Chaetomium fimeti]
MVRTRSRLAGLAEGRVSSTPGPQGTPLNPLENGNEPGRPSKPTGRHGAKRGRAASRFKTTPPQQRCAIPNDGGTKRPADGLDPAVEAVRKRQPRLVDCTERTPRSLNSIKLWAGEGQWPQEYIDMQHILARKRSMPPRRSSGSAASTTLTTSAIPSDQKPGEDKSGAYKDSRYALLLQTKGSYMRKSELGITDESKRFCQALLDGEQPVPTESLFDQDIFENVWEDLQNSNKAKIVQDISRLIVPSAETLTLRIKALKCLTESVDEGWNNSVPLTGTRPQPDYSAGFKREAFGDNQLAKLSPFLGDFLAGDRSLFMATHYMYFPFLSCEVQCGGTALDVADRENAHSMTLAVRAVVELFRLVKREAEVHRQILASSISHNHRAVRIYGHYAVIDGNDVQYYRHPIHDFSLTALDGEEKWRAYRFTRNVYETWVPAHLKNICSAIDQLPSELYLTSDSDF